MTVVPEGCDADDGAGREADTNERLPPEAELLELGLGGAVLNQHAYKQLDLYNTASYLHVKHKHTRN